MCGLLGFIAKSNRFLDSSQSVQKMLNNQNHRGPDDSGAFVFNLKEQIGKVLVFNDENLGYSGVIAFSRLSILDLSINGHQPMSDESGMVTIVFNGEIYNAFEYREELIKNGFRFKSQTDTEVILNLYLAYGFDTMIRLLNGMFAISIVDLRVNSLFLARDRFGIKPLYIYENENVFCFSSEIKSFLDLDSFRPELNVENINEYLLFRNNIKGTLFKNVYSVSPGTYLKLDYNCNIRNFTYFDINDFDRDYSLDNNNKYRINEIEEVLGKAVKDQMISDVKLGCQLSGGVDSSLITHLAKQQTTNENLECISVTFENHHYSEEKYIDFVSEKTSVAAHKYVLSYDYFLNNIEKATWHMDLPINHPNTLGIYLLSEKAKKHVTVLLSGEGADELFGGYDRFLFTDKFYLYSKFLYELKKSKNPLKMINIMLNESKRSVLSSSFIHLKIANQLYSDFDFEKAIFNRTKLYNSFTGDSFDKQVKYELSSYLPDLLNRQDKMSMAHSIENRVPFLDNNVVDLAFKLPKNQFFGINPITKKKDGKFILKEYCSKIYGPQFSFRSKMGFGIPIKQIFEHNSAKELMFDMVIPGLKRDGIFNYRMVEKWYNNIHNIKPEEVDGLWVMFAFQIWKEKFKLK
jgi:asparagine synthase (glutamine-hydrolysing)